MKYKSSNLLKSGVGFRLLDPIVYALFVFLCLRESMNAFLKEKSLVSYHKFLKDDSLCNTALYFKSGRLQQIFTALVVMFFLYTSCILSRIFTKVAL